MKRAKLPATAAPPVSTVKALAIPCMRMKMRIPIIPEAKITEPLAGRKNAVMRSTIKVSPISRASILPQREM